MTWSIIIQDPIPNHLSFCHLMKLKIQTFFMMRYKKISINLDTYVPSMTHDEIEKEIYYLTSDLIEPITLHNFPIQPLTKYERLEKWYAVLSLIKDSKLSIDTIPITKSYHVEKTTRIWIKSVQILFIILFIIYMVYYPSLILFLIILFLIIMSITTCYI